MTDISFEQLGTAGIVAAVLLVFLRAFMTGALTIPKSFDGERTLMQSEIAKRDTIITDKDKYIQSQADAMQRLNETVRQDVVAALTAAHQQMLIHALSRKDEPHG